MNIFKQAKEFPDADYYDMNTGYIYHIVEYNMAKKSGLPSVGIRVTDSTDGSLVGYVTE